MKYKVAKYKIEAEMKQRRKFIIYTLAHPETKQIFYVGSTMMPYTRLNSHKQTFGFKPVMEEVETVFGLGKFGRAGVSELEAYWIQQFKSWGFNLTNSNSIAKKVKQLA